MTEAGSKFLAILCNKAVVELVLNKPNALRRSPCDRHASTAAIKINCNRKFNFRLNSFLNSQSVFRDWNCSDRYIII